MPLAILENVWIWPESDLLHPPREAAGAGDSKTDKLAINLVHLPHKVAGALSTTRRYCPSLALEACAPCLFDNGRGTLNTYVAPRPGNPVTE